MVRGRVVADAAHKFTTLGLIGLTGKLSSSTERNMSDEEC